MNRTHVQQPTTITRVIEFPRMEGTDCFETGSVEDRIKELMEFAESFGRAPFGFFRGEACFVRQFIEELLVKVNALDWIARVAKRSTGSIRESLWADIERALIGLEEAAELLIRAEEEWTHPDISGPRERLLCMDRF